MEHKQYSGKRHAISGSALDTRLQDESISQTPLLEQEADTHG